MEMNGEAQESKMSAFLEAVRKEPIMKDIMEPIKAVLKAQKSVDLELEIVAMQILLGVKLGDNSVLQTNFMLDTDLLHQKIGRSITKTVVENVLQAIDLLLKTDKLQEDYVSVLNILKNGFIVIQSGNYKKIKREKQAGKVSTAIQYDNQNFKEVLVQFESNQSVVYLLNLVNKSYAEELPFIRVNKIVAALEIIASIRETGENKLIEFGKMTLEDLRKLVKGSVSLEILTICLNANLALIERMNGVEGITKELKAKIYELKLRLEHIASTIRES